MGLAQENERKTIREQVDDFSGEDPLLLRKAIVSRYFNIPINEVTDRLTLNDINKYYIAALHLVDIIDMAPFKSTKKQ